MLISQLPSEDIYIYALRKSIYLKKRRYIDLTDFGKFSWEWIDLGIVMLNCLSFRESTKINPIKNLMKHSLI